MDPNNPNLYSYCGNNPTCRIDPSGEFLGFLCKLAITWIFNAAYDAAQQDGNFFDNWWKNLWHNPRASTSGYFDNKGNIYWGEPPDPVVNFERFDYDYNYYSTSAEESFWDIYDPEYILSVSQMYCDFKEHGWFQEEIQGCRIDNWLTLRTFEDTLIQFRKEAIDDPEFLEFLNNQADIEAGEELMYKALEKLGKYAQTNSKWMKEKGRPIIKALTKLIQSGNIIVEAGSITSGTNNVGGFKGGKIILYAKLLTSVDQVAGVLVHEGTHYLQWKNRLKTNNVYDFQDEREAFDNEYQIRNQIMGDKSYKRKSDQYIIDIYGDVFRKIAQKHKQNPKYLGW